MTKDKYNSSTAVYETSAQVEFSGDIASPESTPAGPLSPVFKGTTLRYTGSVKLRMYEELSLIYEDGELYYEDAGSSIYAFEVTVPSYESELLFPTHGAFAGHCSFYTQEYPVVDSAHARVVAPTAYPTPVLDMSENLHFAAESNSVVSDGTCVELSWGSYEHVFVGSVRSVVYPSQFSYRDGSQYRIGMYRSNHEMRYPGDLVYDLGAVYEAYCPAMATLNKDSHPLNLSPVVVSGVHGTIGEPLFGVYSKELAACIQGVSLAGVGATGSPLSVPVVAADYSDYADAGDIHVPVLSTFGVTVLTISADLFDVSQRFTWEPVELANPEYADGSPLISGLICETSAYGVYGESVDFTLHGLFEFTAAQAVASFTIEPTRLPEYVCAPCEVFTDVAYPGAEYSVSAFTGIESNLEFTVYTDQLLDTPGYTDVYSVSGFEFVGVFSPEQFQIGPSVVIYSEYIWTEIGDSVPAQSAAPVEVIATDFTISKSITVCSPVQVFSDFFSEPVFYSADTIYTADAHVELAEWEAFQPPIPILAHIPEYVEHAYSKEWECVSTTYVSDIADIQLTYDGDAFGMTVISAHPPQYVESSTDYSSAKYCLEAPVWEPYVHVAAFDSAQECAFYGSQIHVDAADPFINGYAIPRTPALVTSYAANMGDSATLYRYGVLYRGIDTLYRVGSGARELMTGGLAYAVDVRVADLQCTLGIPNKALIISVEFHDSLQDQHRRSGLGDEGSKGRRSVLYRSELYRLGLVYAGAGPVYASDVVFDQDRLHAAVLTFECQTPWDVYEISDVEHADAAWLVPPAHSDSAVGHEVYLELPSTDIFGREAAGHALSLIVDVVSYSPDESGVHSLSTQNEVIPETLYVSLLAPMHLPVFACEAIPLQVTVPTTDHATLVCEVSPTAMWVALTHAIILRATLYAPEHVTYVFENSNIYYELHEVVGGFWVYSPEPAILIESTVYAPEHVTYAFSESDMDIPATVYVPDCISWKQEPVDLTRFLHAPELLSTILVQAHSVELLAGLPAEVDAVYGKAAPYSICECAHSVEITLAGELSTGCGQRIAGMLADVYAVFALYWEGSTSGITQPHAALLGFGEVDPSPMAGSSANLVGVITVEENASVVPNVLSSPADIYMLSASLDRFGDALFIPAHAAVTEYTSWAHLADMDANVPTCSIIEPYADMVDFDGVGYTGWLPALEESVEYSEWGPTLVPHVDSQSTFALDFLFGSTSIGDTMVVSLPACLLDDTAGTPEVYLSPSRAAAVHEVRAEYLCLLECKVCRPLPHTEVQSATLAYAPIILEYDYENTDPSEYAFIM